MLKYNNCLDNYHLQMEAVISLLNKKKSFTNSCSIAIKLKINLEIVFKKIKKTFRNNSVSCVLIIKTKYKLSLMKNQGKRYRQLNSFKIIKVLLSLIDKILFKVIKQDLMLYILQIVSKRINLINRS